MLSVHKLSLLITQHKQVFLGTIIHFLILSFLKVFSINCESTSYSSSWLVTWPYRECEIHLLPKKNLQKATVHAKTIRKVFAWIRSLLKNMQNMFWSSWSLSMNPSSLHRLLRDLATVPGWYEKLFNAASDNIGMAEADIGVSVHDSVSRLLFTWWSSTSTPATFSHGHELFRFCSSSLLNTIQQTSDSDNDRTSADKYQVDWWRKFQFMILLWFGRRIYDASAFSAVDWRPAPKASPSFPKAKNWETLLKKSLQTS